MTISCPLINASPPSQRENPDIPLEPCRLNPPCEKDSCRLAQRVSKLISQLSEPTNVTQSVIALNSFLAKENLNVCDVANFILKQKCYDDEDMKCAFGLGAEQASRKITTQSQNTELEFFDSDGNPDWYAIAVFCRNNIDQLSKDREIEFIDGLPSQLLLRHDHNPSQKQARWLIGIFVRLGGRIINPKTIEANIEELRS